MRSVITGKSAGMPLQKGVRRVYTFGDRGKWIAEGAKEAGKEIRAEHFASLEDAAKTLDRETKAFCFW